jgi:MIP family channel proteins
MNGVAGGDVRRRLTAEAVGTFFLVLIGPGAVMVDARTGGALGVLGIAAAFAVVVVGVVYLSGAHINPAVSIACWSSGRLPGRRVGPYIAAQCGGAVAGSLVLRAVIGNVGQLGATLPRVSVASAFAIEWLLSFALMWVIVSAATNGAPWAIGLTVGFCALIAGPATGASMNPARSFGPALVGGIWGAHWLYWCAPITGMAVAARLYDWMRDRPID